ncbi:hypothetical protein JXO52_10120 [bacterium]|nr:hypothetical protein [bacterium]
MKKTLSILCMVIMTAAALKPAWAQEVRSMTFDRSTSAILPEANVILIEEKGMVKVMREINNTLPEGGQKVDLKKDDVVMGLNGKRIKTMQEFHDIYDGLEPKSEIKMAVRRGEDPFFVTFSKIDPADMPRGTRVMTRTFGGTGTSDQHTAVYTGGDGFNAGGYLVGEKGGSLVVNELLPYMHQVLGDIDIQKGDRILSLNGESMESLKPFMAAYTAIEAGAAMTILLNRNGEERTVRYDKPNAVVRSVQFRQ